MRYRFLLMASFIFLFYFATSSLAASTLVVGNSDSLAILTYTKYLDERPVLLFSEQIEDKKIDLLNKIESIVFCNSTWQDLAVGFATHKEEKQRTERKIWQKINEREIKIAYIFSQDGEFYVPKGRNYTLKARIIPELFEFKKTKTTYKIIVNKPLLEIDGKNFSLGNYLKRKGVFNPEGFWWELKKLNLGEGEHKIKLLTNNKFKVDLVILEQIPDSKSQISNEVQEPEITFRKINPTKYEVRVKRAKRPFWLVFSETFHNQWRLYQKSKIEDESQEIVADYPQLGIKEARHEIKFTPLDIKYLFRKSLTDDHYLVNGYANGWYIEPEKLGLRENFTLILYFWPQSLFYLGLGISGLTFLGCIGGCFLKSRWKKSDLRKL